MMHNIILFARIQYTAIYVDHDVVCKAYNRAEALERLARRIGTTVDQMNIHEYTAEEIEHLIQISR